MQVLITLKFYCKFGRQALLFILFIFSMMPAAFAAGQASLEAKDLSVTYDPGLEPAGRQAAAAYPAIKQALEALLPWALDFRATLVLLADHNRFKRLAGHELVVAFALPDKNAVVIDHSRMNTSPVTLRTTFKHELCHLLLHHYISDDNLPRWLDEGVCQWVSDGLADILVDTKRDRLSAAVLSGTCFDLEKLQHEFPQDNDDLMLAYAQSRSMVEFLSSSYGAQGIRDLLKLLQQGYDPGSAFERLFSISIDEFQYRWRAHLKKNINWLTYLSIHLYEIVFAGAALLTIWGSVRKMLRRRAYSRQEDEEDTS
jgi:hypothetical protein